MYILRRTLRTLKEYAEILLINALPEEDLVLALGLDGVHFSLSFSENIHEEIEHQNVHGVDN